MVFLIATEATLFALLLFVDLYLRSNSTRWPPKPVEDPELVLTTIRSVVLIGSSIPVALAARAFARSDQVAARRWLLVTMAMGTVFLAGHVQEYLKIWPEFTVHTDAYGSIFYTVTGLHALHLIVGLGVLMYVWVQSLRGRYDRVGEPTAATAGVLYWHFVDVVWVFVYVTLYLSVRLR
ncbi:cytochrome c oxidase subunit 3 [Aquihabitans sp. McL0605]|uniref:cytochrome c oxidase subunit 3 n=1 Tax=Aquihabitans sp. McL0605 TaxID=3415671 RepID=UPI003CEC1C76